MRIDKERCTGCGFCLRDCPVGAIAMREKIAVIDHHMCTECRVCLRVCEHDAVVPDESRDAAASGAPVVECDACPIKCRINAGYIGACHRYRNDAGELVRTTPLHAYEDVREIVGRRPADRIRRPVVTAIGAGTTYPDCKPAPVIACEDRDGVDVVTVVTEVPLSYSSILVKVDTDVPIGKEGERIFVGKREVGMVETEQYGSKMLHIGGVNRLTGKNGFIVARTITDIANRKAVKLKIENGTRLTVQVGRPPVIGSRTMDKMRVGCGSATLGIFAPLFVAAADEVIVLDAHITGQMSRHVAGQYAGAKPSGITLRFKESTPGRCFGDHGDGWGGTTITDPAKIVSSIDMNAARPGMTLLITETTGQKGAMFRVTDEGGLSPMEMTEKAKAALAAVSSTCEPTRVSAVYTGGAGGSARAGVTRYPIRLTDAVHEGRAQLTIGGCEAYVLPGGGITFMADVEKVKAGSFYWTPTPATICPLEYTMERVDYERMGGHVEAMKPFKVKTPAKE
ncbi:MAG: DUF362 domain-containing protein [Desulfobacterales bacterium]